MLQAERWMVDRNGSYLFLPILVETLRSQISLSSDWIVMARKARLVPSGPLKFLRAPATVGRPRKCTQGAVQLMWFPIDFSYEHTPHSMI